MDTKKLSLNDLKKVSGGTGNDTAIGFNCVACNTFIPVTIEQVINARVITCPYCNQKYDIHKPNSAEAEEALRKVQEAMENIGK